MRSGVRPIYETVLGVQLCGVGCEGTKAPSGFSHDKQSTGFELRALVGGLLRPQFGSAECEQVITF